MVDRNRESYFTDVEGEEHFYRMQLFPAGIGYDLSLEIADACSGLVAPLLELTEGKDLGEITQIIGAAIPEIARNLIKIGGSAMVLRLLSHTKRDGEKFGAQKRKSKAGRGPKTMSSQLFDEVYSGNYGELLRVLVWVISENFGSFFAGLTDLNGQSSSPETEPVSEKQAHATAS